MCVPFRSENDTCPSHVLAKWWTGRGGRTEVRRASFYRPDKHLPEPPMLSGSQSFIAPLHGMMFVLRNDRE